jgi:Tol biopolymer transport system component
MPIQDGESGRARLVVLAAAAALLGCNQLLGIEPPRQASDAAAPPVRPDAAADSATAIDANREVDGPSGATADAAVEPPDVASGPGPAADGPGERAAPDAGGVTGVMTRVSVSSDGTQADDTIDEVSVSGDGDLVAFSTVAANLVASDSNEKSDIFVHRRSTGETSRLSLASDNAEANGDCGDPLISADGKVIVFTSFASNLGPTSPPLTRQVYSRAIGDFNIQLRSRLTLDWAFSPAASSDGAVVAFDTAASSIDDGDTNDLADVYATYGGRLLFSRISIGTDGVQGNGPSGDAAISADGSVLAFLSSASNLVAGDTNNAPDVFVRGLLQRNLSRVSVSSSGEQGNGGSGEVAMSGDGKQVAFSSVASNLVTGDTNNVSDVFVHDLTTHQTVRVSVSSAGVQGNASSYSPSLSGDGRLVAFGSEASNLVAGDVAFAGDTNYEDVFVHDLRTHTTVRVSVAPGGARANGASMSPAISANGRVVVFRSEAPNLVPGDTNGRSDAFAFEFLTAPWM